jgi:hypothetical protein
MVKTVLLAIQAIRAHRSLSVCTDPIELSAHCALNYCLSSLYSEMEIYNSFQSLLFENGNIYDSLQGNIFHIKEFIIHIKKTYDRSQRKKEMYSS